MKLIHTSPELITEINTDGLLGESLCFSGHEYVMTASAQYFVYEIDIDEDKIISSGSLDDEEIVSEIAERLGVDEDVAERVLDGRDSAWDHGGDADDDWWIQEQMGVCAKKMGYEACEADDEQGAVWIVPMLGREKDLVLVKKVGGIK